MEPAQLVCCSNVQYMLPAGLVIQLGRVKKGGHHGQVLGSMAPMLDEISMLHATRTNQRSCSNQLRHASAVPAGSATLNGGSCFRNSLNSCSE